MTDLDPAVTAHVRAALGLYPADTPDLAAAAAVMAEAADAARPRDAAIWQVAVALVAAVRASPGGLNPRTARHAITEQAWPVTSTADLTVLLAAVLTLAATWATDADVAYATRRAQGLPDD